MITHDRRGKVLEELLSTEENYVEDLHSVLYGYRDRLDEAGEEAKQRSEDIFGNMEEIFEFHSQVLICVIICFMLTTRLFSVSAARS